MQLALCKTETVALSLPSYANYVWTCCPTLRQRRITNKTDQTLFTTTDSAALRKTETVALSLPSTISGRAAQPFTKGEQQD